MQKLTVESVRHAIATLEKVSELYNLDPRLTEWSPADLRAELSHIELGLQEQEIRDEILSRVRDAFESAAIAGTDADQEILEVLKGYDITRNDEPIVG